MAFYDRHKCQNMTFTAFMTVIKCHYVTPKYVNMGIELTTFFSKIKKKELRRNTMQPKNKN